MPDDWITNFYEDAPPSKERASPSSSIRSSKTPFTTGSQEVDQRLEALKKSYDRINKQLDEIYEKSGMTRQMIEDYLNNPNNFTPAQWTIVQRQKGFFEERIWKMVGAKFQKVSAAKKELKSAKARKGKTLGGRKNWMPMR